MFENTETADFSKGTFALYGLQKVEIIDVNLPQNKRHISWVEFGENGETKRWVSVDALKPLPKPFVPKMAVIDPQVMADLEALPSAVIDIPALVERVVNGGVAADGAAEVQAARLEWEIDDKGIIEATGERVQIVGTDLFSQRKVAYLDLEGVDAHWLDVRELKPITAVLEMDLAKQRDELQAQLAAKQELIDGLREETAKMSDQIDTLTADYDTKLKAQLDLNNRMKRDLDAETEKLSKAALRINELREAEYQRSKGLAGDDYDQLEHLIMHSNAELLDRIKALEAAKQQPQRRKIETRKIYDPTDKDLTDTLNAGWRVVFETMIVNRADERPGDEVTHVLRLERDVKEDISPSPLETNVALDIPVSEGEPLEEVIASNDDGDDLEDVHTDAWGTFPGEEVKVPDLVPQPVMLIDEPAPLPTMVRVGNILIDPVEMPYAATLAMGVTADELIAKLNEQVMLAVDKVRLNAPRRSAPVPLLLTQPQAQP